MLRRKTLCICLLLLAAMAFSACTLVETTPFVGGDESAENTLAIWALSDIHPRTTDERVYFEHAVDDVNGLGGADMGLIAGDLLRSRSKKDDFEWFLKVREQSLVPRWFEIAGNHDVRSQPLFSEYFPDPPYYGISVGNILILMLSDQSVASSTTLSDKTFLWWKQMVRENQDKIIITVSHAQLKNSGLLGSIFKSRTIEDSARFEEVLEEDRVALWLSGHTHLPQGLANTLRLKKRFNNTCFVNVSSISREAFLDSQSRMLVFTKGESTLWVRSRNHTKERYDNGLDVQLKLEKPFVWDGGEPVLILPADV